MHAHTYARVNHTLFQHTNIAGAPPVILIFTEYMADSRKRIAGAFLIGSALVAGAFFISRQSSAQVENGAVVAAPERTYIPASDSNADGVPNWRESLLTTETITLTDDTATSTYERPTTITGKFATNFLEDMLRARTYGQFGDSQEELVEGAVNELIEDSQDVLFTEEDITLIENEDEFILRSYGNHVAAIVLSQNTATDNEAIILQDALRYNDPERLKDLEPIAASYVYMVKQMLEAPVPQTYTKEHLDLLNAYNAIREDIHAMQKVYDDSLYTLVRMKRYPDDVLGLYNALSNLYFNLEHQDQIIYAEGEPAQKVMSILESI